MMRSAVGLVVAASVLFAAACGAPGPVPEHPTAKPVYGLVLIDWSTSADTTAEAELSQTNEEMLALVAPGSSGYVFDFRLITEASGLPDAALGRVEIPAIGPPPDVLGPCPNPVDPKLCQRLASDHGSAVEAYLRNVAAARERVAAALRAIANISRPPAEGTDIEGAMQVAETAFSSAPSGSERWLIVLSDMRECLGACELKAVAPVRIPGVRVVIAGFGDSGSGDMVLVRDGFNWYFTAAGARVSFLLPHEAVIPVFRDNAPGVAEVH